MKRQLLSLLVLAIGCLPLLAQNENPTTVPGAPSEAIANRQDMRFGMFIHWGPVSLKGTEIGWSRGREVPIEESDALRKQFNPVKFDAAAWARVAKAAGMKYLVLTTKHHDGFCLWPSAATEHDIMSTSDGPTHPVSIFPDFP
jgi:alpha-L-fucosidase